MFCPPFAPQSGHFNEAPLVNPPHILEVEINGMRYQLGERENNMMAWIEMNRHRDEIPKTFVTNIQNRYQVILVVGRDDLGNSDYWMLDCHTGAKSTIRKIPLQQQPPHQVPSSSFGRPVDPRFALDPRFADPRPADPRARPDPRAANLDPRGYTGMQVPMPYPGQPQPQPRAEATPARDVPARQVHVEESSKRPEETEEATNEESVDSGAYALKRLSELEEKMGMLESEVALAEQQDSFDRTALGQVEARLRRLEGDKDDVQTGSLGPVRDEALKKRRHLTSRVNTLTQRINRLHAMGVGVEDVLRELKTNLVANETDLHMAFHKWCHEDPTKMNLEEFQAMIASFRSGISTSAVRSMFMYVDSESCGSICYKDLSLALIAAEDGAPKERSRTAQKAENGSGKNGDVVMRDA